MDPIAECAAAAPGRKVDFSTFSDADLLREYSANRSADAFLEIVNRHRAMVYHACLRLVSNAHDAEDAAQAVFLVLAQRPGSVTVRESLACWLHKVARNIAINLLQSKARRTRREEVSARMRAAEPPPAETDLREEVDAALAQVPARLREAVVLRYLEGRDQESAAQVAGCPRGTLARRAVEGLERLRAILTRRGVVVAPAVLAGFLAQESMAAAPALAWSTAKVAALAAGLETGRAALLAQSAGKALAWAKVKAYALAVSLTVTTAVAAPLVVMELRKPPVEYHERATLTGPVRPVRTWWVAAFSPDGKTLATAFWDNTLRLWDVPSQQEIRTMVSADHAFGCAAFSPDGKTLATGYLQHGNKPFVGVRLWDVATGQLRRELPGHTQNVYAVAFHPDGQTLVSTCRDGVRFWDVQTGTVRRSLPQESVYFNSLAMSPDGKMIALGGGPQIESYQTPGTIRLLDTATGNVVARLAGHASFVYIVAFSPDGKTLASGDYQGVVRLWDVGSGKERAVLPHSLPVVSLSFSPDGKLLAVGAGSHDRTLNWIVQAPGEVKLWDPRTGKELAVMQSNPPPAMPVVFSPDGKTLVTGAADGTVKLWDVSR